MKSSRKISLLGGITPSSYFAFNSDTVPKDQCEFISQMSEILAYEADAKRLKKFIRASINQVDRQCLLVVCRHIITTVIPKLNKLMACVVNKDDHSSVKSDLDLLTANVAVLSGMLASTNQATLLYSVPKEKNGKNKFKKLM